MAVRIRLRRTGKRNAPSHRIVVADSRSPRNGRFIEIIGTYDPRGKVEQVDLERADYWISHGAQPSETVSAILKRSRAGVPLAGKKEKVEEEVPVESDAEESAVADAADDSEGEDEAQQ